MYFEHNGMSATKIIQHYDLRLSVICERTSMYWVW